MTRTLVALAVTVAGLAAMPPALAQPQKVTHYEPSQRLRTGIESCMKDEVMNGANCVKKCQAGFRLDVTSRPPLCIATQAGATYNPPKPGYETPEKKLPKGASGT
jgi:hypothetical protein